MTYCKRNLSPNVFIVVVKCSADSIKTNAVIWLFVIVVVVVALFVSLFLSLNNKHFVQNGAPLFVTKKRKKKKEVRQGQT